MGAIDARQDGACACAGGNPPLPPLTNDPFAPNEATRRATELAGAAAFGDSSCHTVVADTCVPMVTPTDPNFADFNNVPKGYVSVFWYAAVEQRGLGHITQPMTRDFYPALEGEAVAAKAADDVYLTIREYCNIAQWNVIVQEFYQYPAFSFEWSAAVDEIGREYFNKTTHLNGQNLVTGVWSGWPFNQPPGLFMWATHKYRPLDNIGDVGAPVPAPCNQGMVAPWGKAAVRDFNAPAYTANAPPPRAQVSGRLAGSESVLLSPTSSALLTVSSQTDPIPLSITGAIGIGTSNCANGACEATLALTLNTKSFEVHGYKVAALELRSNGSSTGVLQGDALAFNSFSGTLYARLEDGRYDQAEVNSGAVLARWDAAQNRFVMAFSFDAALDGITATLSGTAFGTFINTSPAAKIQVASPSSPIADSIAHVECAGPSGTTVVLDSGASTDRQDSRLDVAWYEDDARVGESSQLTLDALPLGAARDIILMAYDSRGGTGEDRVALDVVDTLAPDLQAVDVCIFPPNHQKVCLDLFDDLHVRAIDQCDGELASSVKITNVTTDGNDSLLSWSEREVCLIVERDGNLPDLVDHIAIEATDASGNRIEKTIKLTVPHDLRLRTRCLHTTRMTGGL